MKKARKVPAATPITIELLDGRHVDPRAPRSLADLPLWPLPTACWMCGISVGPTDQNYELYRERNAQGGDGRTCPDCLRLLLAENVTAALWKELTGEPIDLASPHGQRVIERARKAGLLAPIARRWGWSCFNSGTRARWEFVNLDALAQLETEVTRELAAEGAPKTHRSGLGCGLCGVASPSRWSGRSVAGRGGRVHPLCASCHADFRMPPGSDLDDAIAAHLAGFTHAQPGIAQQVGLHYFAVTEAADTTPAGFPSGWGWLGDDLPLLVRTLRAGYPRLLPLAEQPLRKPAPAPRSSGLKLDTSLVR